MCCVFELQIFLITIFTRTVFFRSEFAFDLFLETLSWIKFLFLTPLAKHKLNQTLWCLWLKQNTTICQWGRKINNMKKLITTILIRNDCCVLSLRGFLTNNKQQLDEKHYICSEPNQHKPLQTTVLVFPSILVAHRDKKRNNKKKKEQKCSNQRKPWKVFVWDGGASKTDG